MPTLAELNLARVRKLGDQLRAELEGLTYTSRDGADLIEVTVDTNGRITEVAVNGPAARRVDVTALAEAFMRAAGNAQDKAAHDVQQRRLEVLRYGR